MTFKQVLRALSVLSLDSTALKSATFQKNIATAIEQRSFIHTTPAALGVKARREFAHPSVPNVVCRGHVLDEFVEGYTIRPLRTRKTGGRGLDGRIEIRRIGGGDKRWFRMVDMRRVRPNQSSDYLEKVDEVLKDDCRSAYIALVSSGDHRRYIIATENMKAGDIIKTSNVIPKMTVQASDGDAYPLAALPVGTTVCCIERFPGDGAKVANAAGSSATLVRKIDDKCIVRMPSKREMSVSNKCIATVGRVSNIDHGKTPLGKAGAARWLGIRPKSGWRQKKTGIHGRKIKPIPKVRIYTQPSAPKPETYRFTF